EQLGDAAGSHMIETIQGSRCPRCEMVVAPPASWCPHHPVKMEPASFPGIGEVITFTTLFSPPEGFKSPLHLALVELDGGARFVCHGSDRSEERRVGKECRSRWEEEQ